MFFLPDWVSKQLARLSAWFSKVRSDGWPTDLTKRQTAVLAVVALLLVGMLSYALHGPSALPDGQPAAERYVRIAPGMTAGMIGDLLEQQGIISSKFNFWLAAKLNGAEGKFQTGTYKLHANMQARDVLRILISGRTSAVRFTIPEGYNVHEIAARLDQEGIVSQAEIEKAAKKFAPYSYMTGSPQEMYRAEGFLFPDTYEAPPGASAEDILDLMTKNFDHQLTPDMRELADERGLTIYELVILASLVEKEARFDEDRPIIAQVFLKRLAIGMPLQSDTTIQYLLDTPKEDVTIEDTKMDSPYNTYQHYGLPPGPIANPGMAAIQAVLHPADTDYLYFVADRSGHNHYSKSYEEHLAEVDRVR